MSICRSHIEENLKIFIKNKDPQFDEIFKRLSNANKETYKSFLMYIDNLLNLSINRDNCDLKYFHIHIPFFDLPINILLEFICIKFFLIHFLHEDSSNEDESFIHNYINKIDTLVNNPIQLDSESGKREYLQKRELNNKLRQLRKTLLDLQILIGNTNVEAFKPRCLINLSSRLKDLLNTCSPCLFFMEVEDLSLNLDINRPQSYVILNSNLSRDDIDGLNLKSELELIEEIKDIVLFDCENKVIHQQFNYSALEQLNREGTNFKNLIIFSFDKKPFRLNKLMSRLINVSSRFYIRSTGFNHNSYSICPLEIDLLLGTSTSSKIEVTFVGQESIVWQSFQENIQEYEELHELISIKLRNIYSLCFNEACRSLILEDIFSNSKPSKIITSQTKEKLLNLNEHSLKDLKSLLERVLDVVQNQKLLLYINLRGENDSFEILLPELVLEYNAFLQAIKSEFRDNARISFINWKTLNGQSVRKLIILEYRDPGKFPYYIYPNILENNIKSYRSPKGLFFSMFFKYNYDFVCFNYNQTTFDILSHPIRKSNFNWDLLIKQLRNQKPENKISSYLWDLENSYATQIERGSVFIKFSTNIRKSYNPSQLFIVKVHGEDHLFSLRAEEIVDDFNNKRIYIQAIDELYEELNLFETTKEEEIELNLLKDTFKLNKDEVEHHLWKILLKRKEEKDGLSKIYTLLKNEMERIGIQMVKEDYFRYFWLDIKSDLLIPRSKKMFREVCKFLDLPEVYFQVMLKKRAKERLASRKSTTKMNYLIAELIERGMFDEFTPKVYFDEPFLFKHDLDEIGFNKDNLASELASLVDLLKPNLKLIEVSRAEMR